MLYSAISHEGFASFRDADVRLEAFDKLVGEENGSKRFAPLRDLLVEGEASKPLEEQVALAAKQADAARGGCKRQIFQTTQLSS